MQVSGKITIWWLGGLKSLTLLRWRWLRVLYASLAEISPRLDDLHDYHNQATCLQMAALLPPREDAPTPTTTPDSVRGGGFAFCHGARGKGGALGRTAITHFRIVPKCFSHPLSHLCSSPQINGTAEQWGEKERRKTRYEAYFILQHSLTIVLLMLAQVRGLRRKQMSRGTRTL